MFDRASSGSSGDGFDWYVHGQVLFIDMKQSRNSPRAAFDHG